MPTRVAISLPRVACLAESIQGHASTRILDAIPSAAAKTHARSARIAAARAQAKWQQRRAGGEAPRTTSPSGLHLAQDWAGGRGLNPPADERGPAPSEYEQESLHKAT